MSAADKWVFWSGVAVAAYLAALLVRNILRDARERREQELRAKASAARANARRARMAIQGGRLRSEWSDDPLKGFRDQRGLDVEPRVPNMVVPSRPNYYGRPQSGGDGEYAKEPKRGN